VTKKILLVSTNSKLQQLGSVAFEVVARWQLFTAASATEAVATAEAKTPDAILIDNAMAAAGTDALAKNLGQHVPLILLAHHNEDGRLVANPDISPRHTVAVSDHPRTLAMDVADVLGWQPPCATGRWRQKRGSAA
jgi:CheY-like chemotaxis protein